MYKSRTNRIYVNKHHAKISHAINVASDVERSTNRGSSSLKKYDSNYCTYSNWVIKKYSNLSVEDALSASLKNDKNQEFLWTVRGLIVLSNNKAEVIRKFLSFMDEEKYLVRLAHRLPRPFFSSLNPFDKRDKVEANLQRLACDKELISAIRQVLKKKIAIEPLDTYFTVLVN